MLIESCSSGWSVLGSVFIFDGLICLGSLISYLDLEWLLFNSGIFQECNSRVSGRLRDRDCGNMSIIEIFYPSCLLTCSEEASKMYYGKRHSSWGSHFVMMPTQVLASSCLRFCGSCETYLCIDSPGHICTADSVFLSCLCSLKMY